MFLRKGNLLATGCGIVLLLAGGLSAQEQQTFGPDQICVNIAGNMKNYTILRRNELPLTTAANQVILSVKEAYTPETVKIETSVQIILLMTVYENPLYKGLVPDDVRDLSQKECRKSGPVEYMKTLQSAIDTTKTKK